MPPTPYEKAKSGVAFVSNSSRNRAACESLEQQQDSWSKHAYHGTWPWKTACNRPFTTHGSKKPHAKASNSSRIRARSKRNTSLKNCRNVTFGIHKKHVSHGTWPGKTALENCLRKPRTAAGFVVEACLSRHMALENRLQQTFHDTWLKKTACESLEQQQDSCPKQTKHKFEKLSERHLWNP